MSRSKSLSVLGVVAAAMVLILLAIAAPRIRMRYEVDRLAGDSEAFAEAVGVPEGTISHRALVQLLKRADGRQTYFRLLWNEWLRHDFGLKYSAMVGGMDDLVTKSGFPDEDPYRRRIFGLLPHVYRTPFSPPEYPHFEITALPGAEGVEKYVKYVQRESPEEVARVRASLSLRPEWWIRIRRLPAAETEEAPRFLSG